MYVMLVLKPGRINRMCNAHLGDVMQICNVLLENLETLVILTVL